MGDVRLNTPRVKVIREGYEDLDELQTTNADMVLWDRTRYRHKWPTLQDAPILWMTFIAWAAARRTGAIPADHKYEAWEAEVLEVRVIDDEEEDEEGRPTRADLGLA